MFGIGLPALAILAPLHARATGAADDELSRISASRRLGCWGVVSHLSHIKSLGFVIYRLPSHGWFGG